MLSNHQIEGDPQVIQLLLRYFFNQSLEEHLIFVAGERVLQDPMAVPFSRGCNLLCIYSNKYIEHPPEKKVEKRRHNQKTMKTMRDLLDDGGQCIYVAPSGGRDRKNREGIVNVATFEPQSVEIFYLMGKKSSKETLFVPFSLDTYDILPPPDSINIDIGESRTFNSQGSALSFGSFIDMETIAGVNAHENLDKQAFRKLRAEAIWKIVSEQYVEINRLLNN